MSENMTDTQDKGGQSRQERWTPGPWVVVEGNEHHGPYITSDWGQDICDCYTMTNPMHRSVANGGDSRPVWFHGEQATANANLIAAAPELASEGEASADVLDEAADYLGGLLIPDLANKCRLQAAKQRAILAKARGEAS